MRVLFINSSLTSGGSERVMTLLANKFADKGIDATMSLVRELEPDTYKVSGKVKLVRYQYGTKNKVVIAVNRFFRIKNQIKNGHFDAVIVFMNDLNLFTLMAAGKLDTPIFISERADPSRRHDTKLYRALEKHYYPKCAAMVLQTPDVMNQFPDELQKKSVVIPNPVPDDIPKPYVGVREKKIVAAGRFTDQKNFPMLIEAFSAFHRNYPDYDLYIYGKGPKEDELREKVKNLGISSSVHFPGFVDDITEKIKDASVYISSSDYEGISNAMIEAMAMGLPVICTDCPVGGAKMMIQDGINGMLVPVGDAEALRDAMGTFAIDREYAERLGRKASEIREKYSVDKITDRWIELVKRK